MKLEQLAKASIRIVSPKSLNPGDYILWSDIRRKVIEIDRDQRKVLLQGDPIDSNSFEWIKFTRVFYVIESYELLAEEMETTYCEYCGTEIVKVHETINFCGPRCKDQYELTI